MIRPKKPQRDVLDRLKVAKFLTKQLEETEESFVFNVDAPYGTGKTFFLDLWKEHLDGYGYKTVMFNSWKADSFKDAFTPLVHEVLSQLKTKESIANQVKKNSGKLLANVSGAVLKALIKKHVDLDTLEEGLATLTDELASIGVSELNEYKKQKEGVEELKASLTRLVDDQGDKIFIFIDELDRCKPLFAIEVLERVKHLFDVDGIIFVIATDKEQLCHSIKAVYGERFDSEAYLRRFFDQSFRLPDPDCKQFTQLLASQYEFKHKVFSYLGHYQRDCMRIAELFELSLRDQQQVFIRVRAALISGYDDFEYHSFLLFFLVALRMKFPDIYRRCFKIDKKKEVTKEEFLTSVDRAINSDPLFELFFSNKIFFNFKASNDEIGESKQGILEAPLGTLFDNLIYYFKSRQEVSKEVEKLRERFRKNSPMKSYKPQQPYECLYEELDECWMAKNLKQSLSPLKVYKKHVEAIELASNLSI